MQNRVPGNKRRGKKLLGHDHGQPQPHYPPPPGQSKRRDQRKQSGESRGVFLGSSDGGCGCRCGLRAGRSFGMLSTQP